MSRTPEKVLNECEFLLTKCARNSMAQIGLDYAISMARRVIQLETELSEAIRDRIEVLLDERNKLAAQLESWKVCNTCGGAPHPSGAICICEGTGSSVEELAGLRRTVLKTESERDKMAARVAEHRLDNEKLANEVIALRKALVEAYRFLGGGFDYPANASSATVNAWKREARKLLVTEPEGGAK